MQFPVPQFTEVEDKLIGSLTFKQFGILFGAGLIIFLAYSLTKDILVLVFFCVLFGLPALGIALVPFNGRPIYKMFGVLLKFFVSPKQMNFHKDPNRVLPSTAMRDSQEQSKPVTPVPTVEDTQARLKKVRTLLEQGAEEERSLVKQVR